VKLSRRDRLILIAPLALLLAGWLLLPALLGLVATFSTYSPFATSARFVGLENYASVLRDRQFLASIRNVAIFTAVAVPLELAIGLGLASLLRGPIHGRSLWSVLLLLPWLVSPIANGVMWHFLLAGATGIPGYAGAWLGHGDVPSPVGDLRLALPAIVGIEVWRMAPFAAFLLLPGVASIPAERFEDATIAGASWWSRLVHVVLPSLRPLLLAVAMLLTGLSLGTFDAVLILTGGGPGAATVTPALYSYQQAFAANDWPAGAASAWLIGGAVLAAGGAYVRLARRPAA
jgi:multiple sugar transport system permease protein